MLQISHRFFSKVCTPLGFSLPKERDYGVGMFFFPQDELKRNQAKKIFEVIVAKEGLRVLGWRQVPIRPEVSTVAFSYPLTWTVTSVMFVIYYLRGNWLKRSRRQLP